MAGQHRLLLLQKLGSLGRKACGISHKWGRILENVWKSSLRLEEFLLIVNITIWYYYLSVFPVCQSPKICRVWKEGRIWIFYLSCPLHFSPWMAHENTRKELFFLLSWWRVLCEFLFLTQGWPLSNSEAISLLNVTVFPRMVFSKVVIWSLSLLRFLGFFLRAIPIRRDNQPWIWHMYINLSLSLFYINHDPPINTGGLLCFFFNVNCHMWHTSFKYKVFFSLTSLGIR